MASPYITTVLPVAMANRVLKWSSNCSMKEAREPVIHLPGVPAMAEGVIFWTMAAECAEPKALLQPVASLYSRSRALRRGRR